MSTELTVLNNQNTSLAVPGGLGVDFSSKLFQLKPATININQPNTTAEGAIKGKLRISETGDQFDEMFVALLLMPQEQRSYYVGESGQLNRTPDNLHCFSRDMQFPDKAAKYPQAQSCATCPRASWDLWRKTKLKTDIPACDAYYYALFIDTVYKMPLQMFIRSKSKQPFEAGMQNVARTLAKLKATGKNPNIFDIGFKLTTKKIQTGNLPSYILNLSDFRVITDEEREQFGDIYLQYTNRNKAAEDKAAELEAQNQVADQESSIDDAVLEGQYVETPGAEITI